MLDLRFNWVPNGSTWQQSVEITDAENGLPIDLTYYRVEVWVVFQTYRGQGSARPYAWFQPGIQSQSLQSPVLAATTENGKLHVVAPGVVQWTFPLSDMQNLMPGTYEIGGVMQDADGFTTQLFVGTLPVIASVATIMQR